MSYCRGIIYVVGHQIDHSHPIDEELNIEFTCYSALHPGMDPFQTYDRQAMIDHLQLHLEDAKEIRQSVAKAVKRLTSEVEES